MGMLTTTEDVEKIPSQALVPLALSMFPVGSRAGPHHGGMAVTPSLQPALPLCLYLPLLGFPQGVEGDAQHPRPFQHQGKVLDSHKQRRSHSPFGHTFSLCTCCDLPPADFMWVPVASTNPAPVLLSCCAWGPIHAYRIPKELSVEVEVLLVSWFFPCNAALVVYSKALGVLCFARARPGSRAPGSSYLRAVTTRLSCFSTR